MYELSRLASALGLTPDQGRVFASTLPGGAVTVSAGGAWHLDRDAVAGVLGATDDVQRRALGGLYDRARSTPTATGPTDLQRANAAQAVHNVRTLRSGSAAPPCPAGREAEIAEARANARAVLNRRGS